MSSVYVADIGLTKVGDHWNRSISELAFDAAKTILHNSSVGTEAIIVANAYSELTSSQAALGPLISDALELEGAEAFKVESAGASGGAAIHVAYNLIKSGQVKSALVVGVEKMRDLDPTRLVLAQGLSEHADISQFFGISFASMNALLARLYMKHFGVDREKLSSFPVLAHKNSSTVEHAQFKRKFSVEEVSRSEVISDPLRVLDCAPVGDGAACALLTCGDDLSENARGVEIVASETSSSKVNFFEREDAFHLAASDAATKKALRSAHLTMDGLDFFEIHDTYSATTALIVESIGLAKRGHSCMDAAAGKFDLAGKHPISTFGGMKARGYPVGGAGIYQLCEAYLQLTKKAGANQVKDASNGYIHSMSGMDGSAYVHILSSHAGAV
ncbi:MAG: thiolase C-terminal domain-containing protein [Nitrososphaerales archaeon]